MYGFHKCVGLSDNSMRASESKNKSPSEYSNPYFRRGHPNLLWLINKPKSGSKTKKDAKGAKGDNDSEEEAGNEEVLGPGLAASTTQPTQSLPGVESQPMPKRKITFIREELNKVRDQQKLILGAINRLQRNNNNLYNQLVMLQNQHDRHQRSINAILNFLANLFRKTLEEQGNSQDVSDIISSMITNQNQQSTQHASVVDLGDFIQEMGPTTYGTPRMKTRGLLPPIPNQNNRVQPTRPSTMPSSSVYQPVGHRNPEMGNVTEFVNNSPIDMTFPSLRQELEKSAHERMKVINDHNATDTHGLDLPETADLVANAPNTLSIDQGSKQVNFMADPQVNPSHGYANHSPPPVEANQTASFSPIMQPSMALPSLNEINVKQVDLDQLQRLQNEQDSKISELGNLLGPLSPSRHIPDLGDGEAYFDPQPVDPDQYFDTNAFLGNGHFGADENNSNFTLDTDPNSHNYNSSLHTGKMIPHGGTPNVPNPAGTEEVPRNDLRLDSVPDRVSKRQRVG
ncbi:hypothetical protein IL306_009494 [Fusarium sp. DS 682]|nr:hypothetical protein IL306_009494 [Fusarium sp. DS 682]